MLDRSKCSGAFVRVCHCATLTPRLQWSVCVGVGVGAVVGVEALDGGAWCTVRCRLGWGWGQGQGWD